MALPIQRRIIGTTAVLAALVSGCDDGDSGAGSDPVIVTPTPTPTPVPTATPTPAPTPTPTPTPTSPYYTAYDAFVGVRTMWMECGKATESIPRFSSDPNFVKPVAFNITVNRNDGNFGIVNTQSSQITENIQFLSADMVTPFSDYVQPTVNQLYSKVANGRTYLLSTGSIELVGRKLAYAKNILYRITGKTDAAELFCTTGVNTAYADVPAANLTYATGAIVRGIAGRVRVTEDLDGKPMQLVVNKATNSVTLSFSLAGTMITGQPVSGTVTGTGTIDEATGRFSGSLNGADQNQNSGFSGQLYGPSAEEAGVVVTGTGALASGLTYSYTFAGAARR